MYHRRERDTAGRCYRRGGRRVNVLQLIENGGPLHLLFETEIEALPDIHTVFHHQSRRGSDAEESLDAPGDVTSSVLDRIYGITGGIGYSICQPISDILPVLENGSRDIFDAAQGVLQALHQSADDILAEARHDRRRGFDAEEYP